MAASSPAARHVGQTRHGSRLLRTVGRAPHASSEDHYEDSTKRSSSPNMRNVQASNNATAESQSSSNEIRLPPSRKTRSEKPILPTRSPTVEEDDGLRYPPTSKLKRPRQAAGAKRDTGDEDHDEPLPKRRLSPVHRTSQQSSDIDIDAEPVSSNDELSNPPPSRSKQSSKVRMPTPTPEPEELKAPPTKPLRSLTHTQSGARGDKAGTGADEDKENSSAGPSGPSTSGAARDGAPIWGMEHMSQRSDNRRGGPKTFGKKGRTPNIHAQQSSGKNGRLGMIVPKQHATNKKNVPTRPLQDDDDDSDVSMVDDGSGEYSLDELLGDKDLKYPKAKPVQPIQPPEDKELRLAPSRAKPTVLRDQLGDWMQQQEPESSQPASSAPQEALDDLKVYINDLPQEEAEGSQCTLCKTTVTPEDYWEYWKGKENTIKNQNRFCKSHRMKAAWEEYRSEDYPDIDWTALPRRIQKHRMVLFKMLNNELPSAYRDRYEPIALTGKAAAVPSRRKDLPEHVQQELDSYAMDDQSTYPGYYGPRGRRVITENVMRILKNEIKNCTDSVVQGSGPATFVQAVLVPETAILLIMEDCVVDREAAEEIREKTYELGVLLNEEIEDDVVVHEHSEDEDGYFGGN